MGVLLALVAAYVVMTAALVASATEYNVVNYGARPDGRSDSANAFLAAWTAACNDSAAAPPPVVRVPAGTFLVSQATFKGPCRSPGGVVFAVDGTVVAPEAVDSTEWIMFHYTHGLTLRGGTLDGRGQAFWECRTTAGRQCPKGTTTLNISQSKNVSVDGLTLRDSKNVHMKIFDCAGVTLRGLTIVAPGDSPNTDGMHVQLSTGVRVLGAAIGTGDDCVSLGPGTSDVVIRNVTCGPGHGISIGSLGGKAGEAPVRDVTVEQATLTGTQNGLRIKTWGKPYRGLVTGVTFAGVAMVAVQNPIVVDQNYCPGSRLNCRDQNSGVKISGLNYTGITGTSATPVAVLFDCSGTAPCDRITLDNISLTYDGQPAKSSCKNAHGSATGTVVPPSCL